jgi:type III restriction enzyme
MTDIPLSFAKKLTEIVNNEWESGSFLNKVNPITQDLLKFWFEPDFTGIRNKKFHIGQKEAILNTIYAFEVLKTKTLIDLYGSVSSLADENLIDSAFHSQIKQEKYNHPKFCIKMATGTGKTWVLNALLIYLYLNNFTKNFLLVAPGLIVYDRLLDAFLGKQNKEGRRDDFNTCDIKANEDLFLPEKYREEFYSFIQNSVVEKQDIGRKQTASGIIAITNWHTLNEDETVETDILLPSKSENTHSLNILDKKFFSGGELEFLASLPNICVFNDEAHHLGTNGKIDADEKKWQEAIDKISKNKNENFIQIDFSATPYNVGSGKKRTKDYFPHIIADFELSKAIKAGLVKTIVLDKRKEINSLADEEIDFRAVRDENDNIIGLSKGQRLMIDAGLKKLKLLEEQFEDFKLPNKNPKMLIICEDTKVSPYVVDFLKQKNLSENAVIQIDSGEKSKIGEEEWKKIKQKLFNIDKQKEPKIIVSVLMLREGFDVNNICVIVPLRSNQSSILLEQVLGRGLRLMWREELIEEKKEENRKNIFELKKPPSTYFDILSVVEHPAFVDFYEDLNKDLIGIDTRENLNKNEILGDMILCELKDNYKDYDLFFPIIIRDKEEFLKTDEIFIGSLKKFEGYTLENLKKLVPNNKTETFISQEMIEKTSFGEYKVSADIFDAQSYNEYLQKMLNAITSSYLKINESNKKNLMPTMQINGNIIMQAIDKFIRQKLFGCVFDPLEDNNWRVLILTRVSITQHIVGELSKIIYEMYHNIDPSEAIVEKYYFSEVTNIIGREKFALDIVKSIYKQTFYPSNKGKLEKDFLEAADKDSKVERIIKIDHNKHLSASLRYIRQDGILANYYPDFMVKIGDEIFVVETKGKDRANNTDTKSKEIGALDWIKRINELKPEHRMNAEWSYVLLTDTDFYRYKKQNATIKDILDTCKLTRNISEGVLF